MASGRSVMAPAAAAAAAAPAGSPALSCSSLRKRSRWRTTRVYRSCAAHPQCQQLKCRLRKVQHAAHALPRIFEHGPCYMRRVTALTLALSILAGCGGCSCVGRSHSSP